MPIITAAGWKAQRGYSGTAFDATLAALIPGVQAFMERFIGCSLDAATYTDEPIDGTGTGTVYTRCWPVPTLTSVKIRTGDTTETLDASSYHMTLGVRSRGRLIREPQSFGSSLQTTASGIPLSVGISPAWPIGRENVLVSYTAGYGSGGGDIPVPADMADAGYILLDTRMANQGHSITQTGTAMGNQTVTFRTPAEAEAEVRRLLAPFRRGVV